MAKLGCFGVILSIILIGAGAFLMISEETGDPILEEWFCPENDTFVRTSSPAIDGGTNINFYCEDDDGGALNSIDGQVLLVIFVPIGVLAVSIIVMVMGTVRNASRAQRSFMQNYTLPTNSGMANVSVTTQSYTTSIDDPELKNMLGSLMAKAQHLQPNQATTLKDKLRQLQEAYDEGLIDHAEFERRKDAILDEIVED